MLQVRRDLSADEPAGAGVLHADVRARDAAVRVEKTDGPPLPDAGVPALDPLGHQLLLLVVEPGHEGQRRQHLRGVDVRIVLGQNVSGLHGGTSVGCSGGL